MVRARKPSQQAMQRAWLLGRRMAAEERRIRPNGREISVYRRYQEFRTAHRAMLEGSTQFVPWDGQLQQLCEREGLRIGFKLDHHVRSWDLYITTVVAPMKEAFWRGWEARVGLEAFYNKRRSSSGGAAAPEVLKVSEILPALPDLTQDRMSETERWDHLTKTLFGRENGPQAALPSAKQDENAADESFWELPDPPDVSLSGQDIPHSPEVGKPAVDEELPDCGSSEIFGKVPSRQGTSMRRD